MKNSVLLSVTSVLSLFLSLLHIADITRGYDRFGLANMTALVIAAVWLFGALAIPQRRTGKTIMLLGGLLATVIPIIHMRGAHAAAVAKTDGALLFIMTMFVLGSAGLFTVMLLLRGLVAKEDNVPSRA